jgi:hypothetical protein
LFTEAIGTTSGGDLNVPVDSGVRRRSGHHRRARAAGPVNILVRSAARRANVTELQRRAERAVSRDASRGERLRTVGRWVARRSFQPGLPRRAGSNDTTARVYGAGRDPLYGVSGEVSTNLNNLADAPGATKILGFVVYRPNLHVRIRKDVTVAVSNEATVNDGTSDRKLFQEDLTAIRYETRIAFMIHDINRAVCAIIDAA